MLCDDDEEKQMREEGEGDYIAFWEGASRIERLAELVERGPFNGNDEQVCDAMPYLFFSRLVVEMFRFAPP